MPTDTMHGATTAGTMAELLRRTGANALMDRTAIGIMAETMARMAARDQEMTVRLIQLGVRGDDEQMIFDRLAERIAKLDVLARGLELTAESSLEQFRQTAAFRERQVAHAREVLEMFADVSLHWGKTWPADVPAMRKNVELLLNANADKESAQAEVRRLEQRLKDVAKAGRSRKRVERKGARR